MALREREAELARVQQIGRIGGLEVDLRTGFRNRRSPEYLLIHGLPPDAVNETHEEWVQRIHPEDREATERKFRDAVAGDVRDYSVQYRIIRPSDGEVSAGFRSNPPSSAMRTERPSAWSARTAMSPSRWWRSRRYGKARPSFVRSPKHCRIMSGLRRRTVR